MSNDRISIGGFSLPLLAAPICEGSFMDDANVEEGSTVVPLDRCPGCGVAPGALHEESCDHAHCPRCGWQRISCDCEDEAETDEEWDSVWTGRHQGEAECEEWGWYVQDRCREGLGFVPCTAGDPGASADLNRIRWEQIHDRIRWSREQQRYVMNIGSQG